MNTKDASKGANSAQEKQAKTAVPAKNQQKSKETDLKAENEKLLKRIEQLEKQQPKNLMEQIQFIEEKNRKIRELRKFQGVKMKLNECIPDLSKDLENENFEEKRFSLFLTEFSEYSRGEEIFKVSNPLIIKNCIDFIVKAIEEKEELLKKEIEG